MDLHKTEFSVLKNNSTKNLDISPIINNSLM